MSSTVPLTPEAARRKDLHRRSMVWTGAFMTACGLAAAYLAFSTGPLPALFFGRLRPAVPPAQGHFRSAKPSLVSWRPWSRAGLDEAAKSGKLVLLDVCVGYNRACAVMDETTYAEPGVAKLVSDRFIALRVDAEARPDLADRYLSGGWPSTVLMLPNGQALGRATFLTPELFLPWARSIDEAWRKRAGKPVEAPEVKDETESFDPAVSLEAARLALLGEGESEGARFARFDRLSLLRSLPGLGWTKALVEKSLGESAALEDPVWGGFFRCADGPWWDNAETEKLLDDQAQAVLAFGSGEAARRTLAYVNGFLSDPAGGFYASQACEFRRGDDVIEGRHYYSLPDAERRRQGIPKVDKRIFAASNADMIRAALSAGDAVSKRRATAALSRFWRGASKGLVRHELSSPALSGLLVDEASFGRALLAEYALTKDKLWLARARQVADAMDKTLLDPSSGAYFDRPALGELTPSLDRLLLPSQNFQALLFLRELRPGHSQVLEEWLRARASRLDPAARAALSVWP